MLEGLILVFFIIILAFAIDAFYCWIAALCVGASFKEVWTIIHINRSKP